ncbi:unnamed protein product [Rhodiola kirilowii]
MDSRARLDHAVFHLTPTRTRCDLVAFCGKSSEKLASGLLEPFVSHLKVAKDEILKGGYSITLRPPSHLDSHWFTKATFQRFVRFVSTPEILEGFVRIEKEIQQIESSIQSAESAPDADDKAKAEANAAEATGKGENSKARLQRVLGSRHAILRREQAMAYQRSLVLGFDLASVDDLLAFASCFGASRLREACVNFRELCVMKHNDSLWMDELAAVKAFAPPEHSFVETSAIVLTSEIEPNTAADKDQLPPENGRGPMPWPGQYPPYMYNSMQQGQHPFPMMQPYPPYYPPNMQWSPNMDQSVGHHRSRKSGSKKKGRSSDGTTSEEGSQTESSDTASNSDFDEYKHNGRNHSSGERGHKKKHKKKSSKTVVIRNINYITSKHGEEDAVYDSDPESQGAEKSGRKNGNLEKEGSVDRENGLLTSASSGNQASETWGNFQNLLMMNKDSDTDVTTKQSYSHYADNSAMDMGGEKPRVQQRSLPSDSFVSSNGFIDNGSGMSLEDLESSKSFRPAMRRGDIGGEDMIFSSRLEGHNAIPSDFVTESAVNKIVKVEDWSIANQSGLSKKQNGITEHKSFDGSYELSPAGNQYSTGSRKDNFVDDSIMVQSHSVTNTQEDSQWKTDISMVFDQTVTKTENEAKDSSENKLAKQLSYEPDDMFFMPERSSGRDSSVASFTPQLDFGAEISFSRDQRRNSEVDDSAEIKSNGDKKVTENGDKKSGKVAKPKVVPRYLSKNKPPEVKNKKPFSSKPAVQKSKQEKEDEIRRKMEELVIERQKRIAERSAATGTPNKPTPKVSTKSR